MTHEEILRQFTGFGSQTHDELQIPMEKIDEFIDRVLTEKDETLYTLGQALMWKLQAAPMISFPELEVYPLVVERINARIKRGDK